MKIPATERNKPPMAQRISDGLLRGACAILAACSDPATPLPQAQFAGQTEDADGGALTPDDADAGTVLDATSADAQEPPADTVAVDAVAPADVPSAPDELQLDDLLQPIDTELAIDTWIPVDAFAPDAMQLGDLLQPIDTELVIDTFAPDVAADVWLAPDLLVGPDVAASVCGDGICAPSTETASTCPADCAPPGWLVCAAPACAAATGACQSAADCGGVLNCAAACLNASCVQACATTLAYNTMVKSLEPLVQCAQTAGCLGPADPGPGGGPGSCGNGKCDGGETHLTCPKDCGFPVSANEQCQVKNCAATYAACAKDKACVSAATCYNQYGNVNVCAGFGSTANELSALILCIQQSCP